MVEIVIATKNKHKIKEIKNILGEKKFKILSLNNFINIPEILEDGTSYKENAVKKAEIISKITNKITLSDDSGIEIEYLNWKPGIYSSRFLGENATDKERNEEILKLLEKIPDNKRKARYVCIVAVSLPGGITKTFEGKCIGRISHKAKGKYGFGYDPIFFVPAYNKNMAELPLSVKNRISHRARALNKAKKILEKLKQKPFS